MSTFLKLITSKTVLGVVAYQLFGLFASGHPGDPMAIGQAAGAVLAAAGARHAVDKAAAIVGAVQQGSK